MNKIIENIANWLVALKERKDKIHQNINAFMRRGNNGPIVGAVVFGTIAVLSSINLYKEHGKLWLALPSICLLILFFFGIMVSDAYKEKVKYPSPSSQMKPGRFPYGFSRSGFFKGIYGSLDPISNIRDENLTSFLHFL